MGKLTKQEIVEGNVLIAVFDGYSLSNRFPDKGRVYEKGSSVELDTTFKYHESMELLMPILYRVCNSLQFHQESYEDMMIREWRGLVEFIKICNEN